MDLIKQYFYVGSNTTATNFGSALYLIICKEIKKFLYSGTIETDNIFTIITNAPTIEPTDFTQNPGSLSPTINPPSHAPPIANPTITHPTTKSLANGTINITPPPTEHPSIDNGISYNEKAGKYCVLLGFQSVNGILSNESIIDIKTYFYISVNVIMNTSDYFLINYVWMGSINGNFDNGASVSNIVNILSFDLSYIIFFNNNEKTVIR